MFWPRSTLQFLLVGGAALVILVLFAAYGRRSSMTERTTGLQRGTPPEHLTRAWQAARCPAEAQSNLDEIALPEGRIADVEILDLPGARLYLPRPWTTMTQHFQGPSPDGVSARTGGTGSFKPWRGPGADGHCRAQVYASIPGERSDDPRFTLGLVFRRYSTRSPTGDFEKQKVEYPFAHQILDLNFFGPENGNPDERPLLKLPTIDPRDPARFLGNDWRVVERETTSSMKRIAFDNRDATNGHQVAKAVEVLEGWALVFPIDDHVRAMVVIERDVPVTRWRLYRERAEQAYRWLRTKPAERGAPPTSL